MNLVTPKPLILKLVSSSGGPQKVVIFVILVILVILVIVLVLSRDSPHTYRGQRHL